MPFSWTRLIDIARIHSHTGPHTHTKHTQYSIDNVFSGITPRRSVICFDYTSTQKYWDRQWFRYVSCLHSLGTTNGDFGVNEPELVDYGILYGRTKENCVLNLIDFMWYEMCVVISLSPSLWTKISCVCFCRRRVAVNCERQTSSCEIHVIMCVCCVCSMYIVRYVGHEMKRAKENQIRGSCAFICPQFNKNKSPFKRESFARLNGAASIYFSGAGCWDLLCKNRNRIYMLYILDFCFYGTLTIANRCTTS